MFKSANDMYSTLDSIPYGEALWMTFKVKYNGPITPHTPAWKLKTCTVYTRDMLHVAENMATCRDFNGRWDYVLYEEYNAPGCCCYSNVMSGTLPKHSRRW